MEKIVSYFQNLKEESLIVLISKKGSEVKKIWIEGNKEYHIVDDVFIVKVKLDEGQKVYDFLVQEQNDRYDLILVEKGNVEDINDIKDLSYMTAIVDGFDLVDDLLELRFLDADLIEFYKDGKQKLKKY